MSADRFAPLQAWWRTLGARERRLVLLAAGVIGLYLVFVIAVQPAWRTVAAAPARINVLDAELQTMQALASEAAELRGTPAVSAQQSVAALQAASERLGDNAKLSIQGDRAVLTLTGASTEQLRGWLAEARSGARARPLEARLARAGEGYSGSIVVQVGGTS